MIYSENAPALENALHKAFDSKRVNLINYRKEYFKVSLEEIENHVKGNHEAEIEFTKLAEAQEYRETVAKLKRLNEQFVEEAKEPEFPDELF